jgi:precorrin-8X/cobalt-precorrin-8 methylmutase
MRPIKPEEIYAESFRIISAEVGVHNYDAREWPIVLRMIHASGDLKLARKVVFTHDAAKAGIRALIEGVPIVTDVTMVAAGIDAYCLKKLNVPLHCYIGDPEVAAVAARHGHTRSFYAMEKACRELGEAIFVVGNAPTALMAICEAVESGLARPRLIVALPVGFVSVAESKEEALGLNLPVIAVPGRKGGSPLAAAAVNALIQLALAEGARET